MRGLVITQMATMAVAMDVSNLSPLAVVCVVEEGPYVLNIVFDILELSLFCVH